MQVNMHQFGILRCPTMSPLKYELTHATGARSVSHTHTDAHTQTNQEGALGVEGVGAAHVDASVAQEFQQTDVVVTVDLQGETNARK